MTRIICPEEFVPMVALESWCKVWCRLSTKFSLFVSLADKPETDVLTHKIRILYMTASDGDIYSLNVNNSQGD